MSTPAAATDAYNPRSIDTYSYAEPARFSRLQKMLWFCAGADIELLKRCPRSEQIKEEGIGGIVLATTVLAFASGSYAMYVVFGPKVGLALSPEQQVIDPWALFKAIMVGLIWALVILNLDRFVVSSTGHGDGTHSITWSEFFKAMPRMIMAMVIGLCLSAPLEIRIMKPEIDAALQTEQQKLINEKNATFEQDIYQPAKKLWEGRKAEADGKIRALDEELAKRQKEIADRRALIQAEAAGTGGSGIPNIGPRVKLGLELVARNEAELKQRTEQVEIEKKDLVAEAEKSKEELLSLEKQRSEAQLRHKQEAQQMDGIVSRVHIAHDKFPVTSLVITLLLMIIEIGPIFFKMMMERGPYLRLVDNQNEITQAKYAITTDAELDASGSNQLVVRDRYHLADTIRDHRVAQYAVQRELAEVARQKFVKDVRDDIEANPGRYMNSPKA
ncbi:MAG: DUF4407 domain-containing protein [Burkholderiales bacterium]|jgi:hypothetical protein